MTLYTENETASIGNRVKYYNQLLAFLQDKGIQIIAMENPKAFFTKMDSVYKDAADRAAKRAAMQADPEWQVFMQKGAEAGYLIAQRNNLMNDAPFAPINR